MYTASVGPAPTAFQVHYHREGAEGTTVSVVSNSLRQMAIHVAAVVDDMRRRGFRLKDVRTLPLNPDYISRGGNPVLGDQRVFLDFAKVRKNGYWQRAVLPKLSAAKRQLAGARGFVEETRAVLSRAQADLGDDGDFD